MVAFLRHLQGLVYSTSRPGVERGKAAWRRRRRAKWKMKTTLVVTLHTQIQKQNPKKIWCQKGGTFFFSPSFWLWFGFKKSDTDQTMVICKTCLQQVVTIDRDSEKMRQSANVTSKPPSDKKKKNKPNEPERIIAQRHLLWQAVLQTPQNYRCHL